MNVLLPHPKLFATLHVVATLALVTSGCASDTADLEVSQQALTEAVVLDETEPRQVYHYTALITGDLLGAYYAQEQAKTGLSGNYAVQSPAATNPGELVLEIPPPDDVAATVFIDLFPTFGSTLEQALAAGEVQLEVTPECLGPSARDIAACQDAFVVDGDQSVTIDALGACAGQHAPCRFGFTVAVAYDAAVDFDLKVQTELLAPAEVDGMISVILQD